MQVRMFDLDSDENFVLSVTGIPSSGKGTCRICCLAYNDAASTLAAALKDGRVYMWRYKGDWSASAKQLEDREDSISRETLWQVHISRFIARETLSHGNEVRLWLNDDDDDDDDDEDDDDDDDSKSAKNIIKEPGFRENLVGAEMPNTDKKKRGGSFSMPRVPWVAGGRVPLLLTIVDLGSISSKVTWGPSTRFLAALTEEGVQVLVRFQLQNRIRGKLALIQLSPNQIAIDRIDRQSVHILFTSMQATRMDASDSHVLVWNAKSAEVHEVNSYGVHLASTFAISGVGEMALQQESIFQANKGVIEICNLQGTVKQTLMLDDSLGHATYMDVCEEFLVASTSNSFIKIWKISGREAKPHGPGSGRKVEIDGKPIGPIRSLRCNCDGTKVSILAGIEGEDDMEKLDSRLFVYDLEIDKFLAYDFRPFHRRPLSHCWDGEEPKLMACETQLDVQQLQSDGLAARSETEVQVITLFATSDHGILYQDKLAAIEAEEQRQLAVKAAQLQADEAATAEKLRLQAEADADAQARRKEAQALLQRHEANSIEKLKYWHFEPNGDEPTPEEHHKEFMAKLVSRLVYMCNHLQSKLANLQRVVRNHKIQHEDPTRALDARVLGLEQAVPGPDAGASSSASSSRQLEERVDHEVAMLGDISAFTEPATISQRFELLNTRISQQQQTDHSHNNSSARPYKMPTALFINTKGGCQIWLSHMAAIHGVQVSDLYEKVSWEDMTKEWKKRFIVDDAPTLAVNRIFTMAQGSTPTRDWLTDWQKIVATPDLDLSFPHLRREFYNRSCAALSLALGDREQYSTFAEIINKARELIKTDRPAAHEKSTWQPTYVEKVRTGPRQQQFAAVQSDSGDNPAATPVSSDGDQVAVVQSRSNNKSRNNGKAKSASQAGNGQPVSARETELRGRLEELDPLTFTDFQWMPVPSTGRLPKPHCNVLMAQLRDYLHTAVPTPLMDAGVEVVDLHVYIAKIDREFKTQWYDDIDAPLLYVRIQIGEATCSALIDCGASRNYIGQDFMVRAGLGPRVGRKPQPTQVTLAHGHTHNSIDRCIDSVPVYFAPHASEAVSFDILDTKFDMILGMSWLRSKDHPVNFFNRTVHVHPRITELLDAYSDVFEGPHGVVPDRPIRHEIILEDGAVPPRGCIYRMSEEELSVLRAQLDDLLEKCWIRPSSSPYGAPVLFVRKKNKDLRLCIDYRELNTQTIRNAGPLPRIDDLLERLGGAQLFSKLDLKSGYHQLEIRKEDRYKTAFKTRYGHFEWLVMPFGLTNAPATFQAAMTTEFRHMLDRYVLIYLDDILVYSQNLEEHVEHLRTVLERLRQAKYKANRDKCEFARQELEYLGHYVTLQGIRPLADKIEALRVPYLYFYKKPTTEMEDRKERRSFHREAVMRDFAGMENIDAKTRKALLGFSYHLSIGNMDEAYKAVKLIKNPCVWENMAHLCIKTKRLDVADHCLGNMGHARGARAAREAAASEQEVEARVAAIAIQLGLIEDAQQLYVNCGRYDLLNNLYQASGEWEKAVEVAQKHDRIHLSTTHYKYAKHLEAMGDLTGAIKAYQLSGTHRHEVPRLLFDAQQLDDLEAYIHSNGDPQMMKWWACYCESQGNIEKALQYYHWGRR
ncbi:hypothetical protein CBR_g12722 [Chara braunii]|uniref:Reverse transcriptase domain-containing protein n=1 Tax=Chara braunii TaxID=69332 RepID=A0A388KSU2_CHABU|nr:hypothetical protein CBR_g12722 [Chara braunii]|eukprot:GBG73003.1 hypothetical protein CBR_g12722 [Chara braunii]